MNLTKRSKFGKIRGMKIRSKVVGLAVAVAVVASGSALLLARGNDHANTVNAPVQQEVQEPVTDEVVPAEEVTPVVTESTVTPVEEETPPAPTAQDNKAWFIAQIKANVAKLGLAPTHATENFMWWQGVCAERYMNKYPQEYDTREKLQKIVETRVNAYFETGSCRSVFMDLAQ